jgi:hypothetical protein
METIAGIVLALSLLGNWIQHNQVEEAKQEADKWQSHAQQNYQELQEAVKVNDTNSSTITALEESELACSATLDEALTIIHRYKETGLIDRATIDILRRQLDESNSGGGADSCRVPEWVVIEGLEAAIGPD